MRDRNPPPYPPDYVSAETLAYRLDCSRATIDAYVKEGRLPKPEMIGNLVRWDFTEVRAFIKVQNTRSHSIVNRRSIVTRYRHPILTHLEHGLSAGKRGAAKRSAAA